MWYFYALLDLFGVSIREKVPVRDKDLNQARRSQSGVRSEPGEKVSVRGMV